MKRKPIKSFSESCNAHLKYYWCKTKGGVYSVSVIIATGAVFFNHNTLPIDTPTDIHHEVIDHFKLPIRLQ